MALDDDIGPHGAACRAFPTDLRGVNWPIKFRPDIPEKYDDTIYTEEFLQIYTTAIQAAGGGSPGHGQGQLLSRGLPGHRQILASNRHYYTKLYRGGEQSPRLIVALTEAGFHAHLG